MRGDLFAEFTTRIVPPLGCCSVDLLSSCSSVFSTIDMIFIVPIIFYIPCMRQTLPDIYSGRNCSDRDISYLLDSPARRDHSTLKPL
jgi:hypothetical protein